MNSEERRRHKRLAIKIPVTWDSEGRNRGNATDAFLFDTHDLTTKGLFLKTHLRPKKGTHLNLTLTLNNKTPFLKVRGRVMWIAGKKSHPYLYPGIGIKFEGLTSIDRRRLSAFIKYKIRNFRDAYRLKNMYLELKNMASDLVELEERHSSAAHFKHVIENAISDIDAVAHILDREINEIKSM